MDKAAFTNPNGTFVESNEGYETFIPQTLPPEIEYDGYTLALAVEAHTKAGQLSGIGELLPNPDLLIRPYVRREAVLSSKIEGTQASMMDIFQFEAEGKTEPKEDAPTKRIREVVNYIHSLDTCLEHVTTEPISLEMIRNAHRILMNGVRGQERTPGKFRQVQNWIGKEGSKIEDAMYVPPPPEKLNEKLAEIEGFLQEPAPGIPVLIQCALVHYQFEAVHPFTDGNGRIGRLLIPLILAERNLLSKPLLYLSVYFERHRAAYYHHLLDVSQNGNWIGWIRFFLKGVIEQATDAVDNVRKLTRLRAAYEEKLRETKASGNETQLMTFLFASPVISIPGAARFLGVRYPAAKLAIEKLQEMGILEELGQRKRGKLFKANDVLNIVKG